MIAFMPYSATVESGVSESISPIAFLCLPCCGAEAPRFVCDVPTMTMEASRAAEAGLELHRCGVCAYWEPALTCFGEPSGQGDSRFPLRSTEGSRSYIAESKSDKR